MKAGVFAIFEGQKGGRPLIAMIDTSRRDFPEKPKLPYFLSIETRLVHPTSDGLPTHTDADDLNAWEDSVEKCFPPDRQFVFLGRVTWNGRRELLYYVAISSPFEEALATLSASQTTRRFLFSFQHDEDWTNAEIWFNA